MDLHYIVTGLLGLFNAILGWMAKELWGTIKQHQKELSALRETLPKEYVRKDDFVSFRAELFDLLHRIETKLDNKQDK